MTQTVDRSLWLALLAPKATAPELQAPLVEQIRTTLGRNASGGQQLLSIGVMPSVGVPALFEDIGPRARIPHVWVFDKAGAQHSTLDLCGRGRFTLLTGIGGEGWAQAQPEVDPSVSTPSSPRKG